ncbi:uncharacterized protein A4U43_C10F1090 [Asparagus officinalis]|uniref:ATP-dependent Clp protease proteolytic subunit n=1 Tax=Asparagus officinalis TaxID=4686 RepID=A0A5P1DZZ8_ASPOF|nr:uncharacterized protein A4U43_C10F1090 [Asparagus officinalis]
MPSLPTASPSLTPLVVLAHGIGALVVVAQLLFLESENPSKPLSLYINSPSGTVTVGLAIYDRVPLPPQRQGHDPQAVRGHHRVGDHQAGDRHRHPRQGDTQGEGEAEHYLRQVQEEDPGEDREVHGEEPDYVARRGQGVWDCGRGH